MGKTLPLVGGITASILSELGLDLTFKLSPALQRFVTSKPMNAIGTGLSFLSTPTTIMWGAETLSWLTLKFGLEGTSTFLGVVGPWLAGATAAATILFYTEDYDGPRYFDASGDPQKVSLAAFAHQGKYVFRYHPSELPQTRQELIVGSKFDPNNPIFFEAAVHLAKQGYLTDYDLTGGPNDDIREILEALRSVDFDDSSDEGQANVQKAFTTYRELLEDDRVRSAFGDSIRFAMSMFTARAQEKGFKFLTPPNLTPGQIDLKTAFADFMVEQERTRLSGFLAEQRQAYQQKALELQSTIDFEVDKFIRQFSDEYWNQVYIDINERFGLPERTDAFLVGQDSPAFRILEILRLDNYDVEASIIDIKAILAGAGKAVDENDLRIFIETTRANYQIQNHMIMLQKNKVKLQMVRQLLEPTGYFDYLDLMGITPSSPEFNSYLEGELFTKAFVEFSLARAQSEHPKLILEVLANKKDPNYRDVRAMYETYLQTHQLTDSAASQAAFAKEHQTMVWEDNSQRVKKEALATFAGVESAIFINMLEATQRQEFYDYLAAHGCTFTNGFTPEAAWLLLSETLKK